MIIVLENADFSAKNIGTIFIPRELNEFTLNAIELSGNTEMTDLQKQMLDIFFENLGAFGTKSTIWSKLDHVLLPFICNSLAKSTVDYKTNLIKTNPNSSYFQLTSAGGIKCIQTTTSSYDIVIDDSYDFDCQKTVMLLNTDAYAKPNNSSDVWSNGLYLSSGIVSGSSVSNPFRTYGFGRGYSTQDASYQNKVFAISRIANNVYTGDNQFETDVAVLPTSYGVSANVITIENGKTSALLWDSYVEMATVKDYSSYNGNATSLYLSSQASGHLYTKNAACGAATIGSVLTKSEMQTLKAEVETLYNVFHTQN